MEVTYFLDFLLIIQTLIKIPLFFKQLTFKLIIITFLVIRSIIARLTQTGTLTIIKIIRIFFSIIVTIVQIVIRFSKTIIFLSLINLINLFFQITITTITSIIITISHTIIATLTQIIHMEVMSIPFL